MAEPTWLTLARPGKLQSGQPHSIARPARLPNPSTQKGRGPTDHALFASPDDYCGVSGFGGAPAGDSDAGGGTGKSGDCDGVGALTGRT